MQLYSARAHEAYLNVLRERLGKDEIKDAKARRRALQPEYDWYMEQLGETVKAHPTKAMKKVVNTLTNLVCIGSVSKVEND